MTVIANGRPVPTPEEMAEFLCMSAERLAAVRRIMNTPVRSRRKATKWCPSTLHPGDVHRVPGDVHRVPGDANRVLTGGPPRDPFGVAPLYKI